MIYIKHFKRGHKNCLLFIKSNSLSVVSHNIDTNYSSSNTEKYKVNFKDISLDIRFLVNSLYYFLSASGMPDQRVWISTSITWDFSKPKPKCHGRYVRNVCVFGLGDLHRLVSEKKLFANKFHYAYQPFTLMCMEEWIFNKSVTYSYTDLDYYRDLMND